MDQLGEIMESSLSLEEMTILLLSLKLLPMIQYCAAKLGADESISMGDTLRVLTSVVERETTQTIS